MGFYLELEFDVVACVEDICGCNLSRHKLLRDLKKMKNRKK